MPTNVRTLFDSVRSVISDALEDDAMSLAAAIAFYTALSFAPLVLLLLTVGGFLGNDTQNELVRIFQQQLGPRAADVTREVVENAQRAEAERTASLGLRWVVGTVGLLLTASGVFGQLQASLNRVWDVQPKPTPGWRGWWSWLRRRLLSMAMVGGVLFLLLVSLIFSSAVTWIASHMGGPESIVGRFAVPVVSFAVVALLFGAMFKVLPDVHMPWRSVWVGATITAALFTAGKFLLAIYVERGGVGEDYGKATGAIIALLVWVYYSAVVLLIGAEITQHYARSLPGGSRARPKSYAQWEEDAPEYQRDRAAGKSEPPLPDRGRSADLPEVSVRPVGPGAKAR